MSDARSGPGPPPETVSGGGVADGFYRELVEIAAEGILVADFETRRFVYANPAICELLG